MLEDLSGAGSHFIVGLEGPHLSAEEGVLLEQLRPAGIILFAKNIIADSAADWISALRKLIADARQAAGREHLLVSVDHEGGRVHRFREPVTHFPHARCFGENSRAVGRAMGLELRELGFNLSFAPVLDVHSEEKNPVIGLRAFGTAAQECAQYAVAFAEGLESAGVLSCGKHFPGHGATVTDSHFELPVLSLDEGELFSRELIPFAAFIAGGFPLMMTAHVHYPALDAASPATLSALLLRRLLRQKMHFQGAVISDDLEMAALREIAPGERAYRALTAGVDLLLVGYPKVTSALRLAAEMARGIKHTVEAGVLAEGVLEESKARIAWLFDYLARIEAQAAQHQCRSIGCAEHRELCAAVKSRTV